MADSSDSKTPLLQRVLGRDMKSTWTKYFETGILNNEEQATIISYVDARVEQRAELLKTTPASTVLKKLLTLHDVSLIQYVLALIDQALQIKPALIQFFANSDLFLSLLKSEEFQADQFICWKSCRILSHLFTTVNVKENEQSIREFLSLVLNPTLLNKQQEAVLFSLQHVLRKPELRQLFIKANGIQRLKYMLTREAAVQLQYQMIFCLWLVSFEKPLAPELQEVVSRIVEIARQSQKEKVMRISLAALRNLASEPVNVEKMVEAKLNKQLEIWNNRRWGDEEIVADLAFLTKTVERTLDDMSSFERYRAEVLSGELEWTPVHFSEAFWRDNITKLAEDNFQLIRVLSELLSNNETKPLTKAVACYDIGEFVRLHPAGRKVVTDLGTKSTVMSILYKDNEDPEVQKQALLCTRKMMVSSW